MFSAAQKTPHKTPQSPGIPPQTHHVLTTQKHQKIANPLKKPPFFPSKYFLQNMT
jgi:LysM repeat protein